MKKYFYTFLFLFSIGLYAQNSNNCATPTPGNLVYNGDFEQVLNINQYPNNPGQLTRACNWFDDANMATPDYLHRFSPSDPLSSDVTLPFNTRGDQEVNPSHGGDAYAGFALTNNYGENQEVYTEIIGTQLQSPLQPGIQYNLSFDISRAENMGSNPIRIQAFLGSQFSINTEYELPIQNDPNGILLENNTFSDNTTGWDTISFTFTANASHTHLYIGGISNIVFQDPNETSLFPTYYYIDNVSLVMNGILPPNDCSDVSIEISTQMPDCNIFENSSTFDICGTFTTNANATSNNLSLNISDLDSGSSPLLTNVPITDIFNVTTSNGLTTGDFCITLNQNSFNLANTYQINTQIISVINGISCNDSTNRITLPFNDCDTNIDNCNDIPEDVLVIVESLPNCEEILSENNNQVCLSYAIPQGFVAIELVLSFDQINGNDSFQLSELNPPVTGQDNNNNDTGSHCFTNITEDLFQSSDQGRYTINATLIVVNNNGTECAINLHQQPLLDFNDCNTDPCSDVSIEISTQMPDCNIFENSSTFDICGTFTTSANASSNSLSLNITNLNSPFPPILSPPVTAFNVTTNNGVLSGNFCVTLNQNSFNSANTYQINAQINSEINGERCRVNTDDIMLPLNDCDIPCENLNNYWVEGDTLFWDPTNCDGTSQCYELEFYNDNTCCENQNDNVQSITFYTSTNSFANLGTAQNALGAKCFKWRIRTLDCPWTNPVCISGTDGPGWTFVEPLDNSRINIYPNPASDYVTISTPYKTNIFNIEIYNLQGNPINQISNVNSQSYKLDVNRLPEGYYVIKVVFKDGSTINKNLIMD